MKQVLCCVVIVMFGFCAPVLAGIGEGHSELRFDYGSTDYDSDIPVDSASSLSLRGGYLVSKMFEVEGQFATSSADDNVLGVNVDTSMRIYMVNGVLNFHPKEEIVPYVMVGVGMANLEVEALGVKNDDQSVAYQMGAGSRFFFGKNKRTAFRVDLSMISEDTFNESSTHTTLAGGFTWRFGQGR